MSENPGLILLVDSNPLLLNLQKDFLSRQRINVACAHSAGEALKLLPALRPQVVILAYELGESDGASCCEQIRRLPDFFTTPVLLLAPNQPEIIERCWAAGCDGVLVRPMHRRELSHVTRSFIDLAKRAAPRVAARVLVRFGCDSPPDLHDYSVNIGAGGIYLATSRKLELGEDLELEFILPTWDQTLLCHGQVAWLNQGESRQRPDLAEGAGVAFQALNRETRLTLQHFVMHSLRTSHHP